MAGAAILSVRRRDSPVKCLVYGRRDIDGGGVGVNESFFWRFVVACFPFPYVNYSLFFSRPSSHFLFSLCVFDCCMLFLAVGELVSLLPDPHRISLLFGAASLRLFLFNASITVAFS